MAEITLCMIVRDEEAMLGACLASARDAVSDIVVVDTGSRDGSKRIAEAAGARVFDFAWRDDFAAARNEALRHARGRWVLVLDADERLAPGSAGRLRPSVADAKFDCGMLRLHDAARVDARLQDVVDGRDRQAEVQLVPRLLRRTDGLTYVDPIHENVVPWLRRRGMKVAGVDVDIVHLGATKEVVDAKAKIERNMRLLRTRIEHDPCDVTAYGYLAHDLLRAGAPNEAFEAAERGWAQVGPRSQSIHRLATARSFLLVQRARFDEARETVRTARELEGDNPDFAFLTAWASETEALAASDPSTRREKFVTARDGYREALRFRGRVFAQSFVVGASTWIGSTRLGTVELLLGRPAEALHAFEAALATQPDERAARLGRAEAMLDLGDAAGALANIEGLLDDTSPDGWTLAAAAVRSLGMLADMRLFAGRAQALLDKGFVAPHRRGRLRVILDSWTPDNPGQVTESGLTRGGPAIPGEIVVSNPK
jgi:glycosyltransferase involved in cell wall biosynthesis